MLELAEDDRLPLLERLKFAAIFSQGLDEFFMVRVAGLLELDEAGVPVRSADGLSTDWTLEAIRERVSELTARQGKLWKRDPSFTSSSDRAANAAEVRNDEDWTGSTATGFMMKHYRRPLTKNPAI